MTSLNAGQGLGMRGAPCRQVYSEGRRIKGMRAVSIDCKRPILDNLSLQWRVAVKIVVFSSVLLTMLVLVACGSDESPQQPVLDETPPGPVTDLEVIEVAPNSATLRWTAAGDDSSVGRATAYDLRYAMSPLRTDQAWALATHFTSVGKPSAAGSPDEVTVTGLVPESFYYFAIVAVDESGNSSDRRLAGTETPIGVITDPSQPEDVLHNLRAAYILRDLTLHNSLFDTLGFEFVFDPIDMKYDPDVPKSWGWEDEQLAARNMFQSILLERVRVQFAVGSPRFQGDDVVEIDVSDVQLSLDTRDPAGGENIIFAVSGDAARFRLTRNASGKWKIAAWEDVITSGLLPTIDLSWGSLKFHNRAFVELRSWGALKVFYRNGRWEP